MANRKELQAFERRARDKDKDWSEIDWGTDEEQKEQEGRGKQARRWIRTVTKKLKLSKEPDVWRFDPDWSSLSIDGQETLSVDALKSAGATSVEVTRAGVSIEFK